MDFSTPCSKKQTHDLCLVVPNVPRFDWPPPTRPERTHPLRQAIRSLQRGVVGQLLVALLLATALMLSQPAQAQAAPVELSSLVALRSEDGLQVNFAAQFELSKPVEEALLKGVPLYFVASVDVYARRWYWRDRRVAQAERIWRLAFQPLTRKYRVTFGSLNQSHDTLNDALGALRRAADWRIAEPGQLEDGASYYLEFDYRLDTTQLPRPMQIGVGGEADWQLSAKRTLRLD
ncbi:hypothetical protein BH09PSE5_BH09PSE5_47530 [soil metagenome]